MRTSGTDGGPAGSMRLDVLSLVRALEGDTEAGDGVASALACGFASGDGGVTEAGYAILRAARRGDLDGASAILAASHPGYAACIAALRDHGHVERGNVVPYLRRRGIRVSPAAANSVAEAAVHLGQAYTTLGRVRDGSNRPASGELAAALREGAEATASDGLVAIADLLGPTCGRARISPHALGRAIEVDPDIAIAAGLSLSPSAGGPVRARDAVLAYDEGRFRLEPVPSDRLRIGERPILVGLLVPPSGRRTQPDG